MQKTRKVTWEEFEKAMKILTKKIQESRIKFTGISGIERGGLPLATKLSDLLDIPYVRYPVNQVQLGMLVVDDICSGGKTLTFYKKTFHPGTKFAVWILKKCSTFIPDFYAESVPSDVWFRMPYEK